MISSALFTRPLPGRLVSVGTDQPKREGDPSPGTRQGTIIRVGQTRGRHWAELKSASGPSSGRLRAVSLGRRHADCGVLACCWRCAVNGGDRVIRWSTALAVLWVAAVAAVASYEHAYDLVRAHGETGWTARLIPLMVDGLIYASSMMMLDSARRKAPVPALALVGSYELQMMVIRSSQVSAARHTRDRARRRPAAGPGGRVVRRATRGGPVPSVRAIRAHLHVGQARAQRLRDYLARGAARRVESRAV